MTRAWHAAEPSDVLTACGTSATGLTAAEAARRLDRDGPNAITRHGGASWVKQLARQFLEPLVVVLIAAAAVSLALGDQVDAAVIAAVVVLNG